MTEPPISQAALEVFYEQNMLVENLELSDLTQEARDQVFSYFLKRNLSEIELDKDALFNYWGLAKQKGVSLSVVNNAIFDNVGEMYGLDYRIEELSKMLDMNSKEMHLEPSDREEIRNTVVKMSEYYKGRYLEEGRFADAVSVLYHAGNTESLLNLLEDENLDLAKLVLDLKDKLADTERRKNKNTSFFLRKVGGSYFARENYQRAFDFYLCSYVAKYGPTELMDLLSRHPEAFDKGEVLKKVQKAKLEDIVLRHDREGLWGQVGDAKVNTKEYLTKLKNQKAILEKLSDGYVDPYDGTHKQFTEPIPSELEKWIAGVEAKHTAIFYYTAAIGFMIGMPAGILAGGWYLTTKVLEAAEKNPMGGLGEVLGIATAATAIGSTIFYLYILFNSGDSDSEKYFLVDESKELKYKLVKKGVVKEDGIEELKSK